MRSHILLGRSSLSQRVCLIISSSRARSKSFAKALVILPPRNLTRVVAKTRHAAPLASGNVASLFVCRPAVRARLLLLLLLAVVPPGHAADVVVAILRRRDEAVRGVQTGPVQIDLVRNKLAARPLVLAPPSHHHRAVAVQDWNL